MQTNFDSLQHDDFSVRDFNEAMIDRFDRCTRFNAYALGRQVMLKSRWMSGFVAVAFCVVAGVSTVALGDDGRPTRSIKQVCEKANAAAEIRYQRVCQEWRLKVADLRRLDRLKRVASDAAGFDEKIAQGFSFFETSSSQVDRMRVSMRKNVVDERVFAQSMADAFAGYQKELITESIAIYVESGIDGEAARSSFRATQIATAAFERAFDSVVAKAKSLATEDWFRFGLVNVGSDIVADGLETVGRENGIWNTEEGSVGDFLAGLLTQVVVEAAIDTLTDPSDQFAKELQQCMANMERELLDGPSGLLTMMRQITTLHQQARLQQFGLATKGGK